MTQKEIISEDIFLTNILVMYKKSGKGEERVRNCTNLGFGKSQLNGLPLRIISNRDSKFTFNFGKAIFEAIGTQISLSIAYHPQIDGQIEKVNQVIKDMPKINCVQEPTKWICYIYLVEFANNALFQRTIGMSPFKALYG